MKDITHEILSEIHHLLSIATEEDLRRTARLQTNSAHLQAALESLAHEKAVTSRRGSAAPPPLTRRKIESGRKVSASANLNGLARELARSFERLGKIEIQEACRAVGLPLSVKAKDARERIIRRVANLLVRMPDEERQRVMSAMQTRADTQTEGWVGVIRKGQ